MIDEKTLDKIKPGSTVKVTESFKEGEKKKTSVFKGIVIARKHGKEAGGTFTVRGVIASYGLEKVYPINSPRIEKVEVTPAAKRVRRAKLYYLRDLSAKKIREQLGTN